jgi:hypothetical protein
MAEVSRRRFLQLCGATSAAVLLGASGLACVTENPATSTSTAGMAATTTTAAQAATTVSSAAPAVVTSAPAMAAAPAPAASPPGDPLEKYPPYNFADVDKFSNLNTYGEGSATTAGDLAVDVDFEGEFTGGISSTVTSFVRWNFSPGVSEPLMATVALDYIFSPGTINCDAVNADYSADVISSNAKAYVQLGVKVIDTSSGDEINLILEERGKGQPSVLSTQLNAAYEGQKQPLTFKPGRTYTIEAYLLASGYIWPEGEATAQATAKIRSMKIMSMQPPWISTRIISTSHEDADTWYAFEEALHRQQNRHYYLGAALVEVSAGGNYYSGQVHIRGMHPKSEIVGLSGSTLAYTANGSNELGIALPDSTSLPMQGKTWRFRVSYDPHYQNPWDSLVIPGVPVMPLFAPIVGMWAETSQAADKVLMAGRESGTLRQVRFVQTAGSAQRVTATDFFDLKNYSLVLPLSRFQALSKNSAKSLPAGTQRLPVTTYAPSGVSAPRLLSNLLTITSTTTLPAGMQAWELSTEPVIIISLLNLWDQYMNMPHLLLESQGVDWPANPHFIQILKQVGESAEAHREYLNGLYWMPRGSNEAIRLVDLPEEVRERVGEVVPGYPLWMIIAGATVAVVIVLSPRLRRWARRVFTVDQFRLWMEANRPVQEQTLSITGHVCNQAEQEAYSNAQTGCRVFFDTVPQRYTSNGAPPDLP